MKRKFCALFVSILLCLLAAPSAFAVPAFVSDFIAVFYTSPGEPYYKTKAVIPLPLEKSKKAIVCVNHNFYDTIKFGAAFEKALKDYSSEVTVRNGEFVPKEDVADYDYVWTFQVNYWKDKNSDDVPEKVKALVLLYDKNFNRLLKSSVKIRKSKEPDAPNCLEALLKEYLNTVFNKVVEVNDDSANNKKAKNKSKKKDKNNKEAETTEESPAATENIENEKQAE